MNWGEVKGAVRHISEGGNYAIYMIEEPPGRKKVKFKKSSYEVLCPWLYFFVKVGADGRVFDEYCMSVYMTTQMLKEGSPSRLIIPPFPNTNRQGNVCLPSFVSKEKHSPPVKAAFYAINAFWVSRGTLFEGIVPDFIKDGFYHSKSNFGRIYKNWSTLSYAQILNADWSCRTLEANIFDDFGQLCDFVEEDMKS